MQQLRRVQDLLSSKLRKSVTLEESLSNMAEEYLYRHDPLEKAKRAQSHSTTSLCPGTNLEEPERRHTLLAINELEVYAAPATETDQPNRANLVAQTKHAVILRDQNQCTYVDSNGHRCQEQRWLQIHHQTPRWYGGSNDAQNLTMLCVGHHQMMHQKQ